MEILSTLASSFVALMTIPILVLLLNIVRQQRHNNKDHQEYLKQKLDDTVKERDEARDRLKYFGSQNASSQASNASTSSAASTGAVAKKRLFISTPVRGFDNVDFTNFVEEVSRMIDGMRATGHFGGIFYENYRLASKDAFEARRLTIAKYFSELQEADVFVAIVPMPSLSSVYFEAGYAAALGRPSIYFTPEGAGKVMPTLMGEAHRFKENVMTVPFDSLDHVQRVLIEEFGSNQA